MKKVAYVFFQILLLCIELTASTPEWFGKLPIKNFELIGYGTSKNLKVARSSAKNEIANVIQTRIKSKGTYKISEVNDIVNEEANFYVEAKTDVVLNDLKTIKEEKIDETWFVALLYENLPIEKKFAKKIDNINKSTEEQNKYLASTPLIQKINEELNCLLNINLRRKNHLWYLSYEDVLEPLSTIDLEKLFINYNSNKIFLNPQPSKILKAGDVFNFSFVSKEDGFVSILDIYENGECFIITSNRKVKANLAIEIPGKSSSNEMVAGLFKKDKPTFDLYVALCDSIQINLSRIQKAGELLEKDEWHFKFGEVLDMMNKYEFCTVLIRTKPK